MRKFKIFTEDKKGLLKRAAFMTILAWIPLLAHNAMSKGVTDPAEIDSYDEGRESCSYTGIIKIL